LTWHPAGIASWCPFYTRLLPQREDFGFAGPVARRRGKEGSPFVPEAIK
jgi:hypothetical protein